MNLLLDTHVFLWLISGDGADRGVSGRMQKLKLILFGSFLLACGIAPLVAKPPMDEACVTALLANPNYEEKFDPWRANNRALKPASKGDKGAQIAFFLSAYVRVSQPYAGGEDLEQMGQNFTYLLAKLGDEAFSKALGKQRPEVRSAVRCFIDMKSIEHPNPGTYRLLKAAPNIDWPTAKAYRNG